MNIGRKTALSFLQTKSKDKYGVIYCPKSDTCSKADKQTKSYHQRKWNLHGLRSKRKLYIWENVYIPDLWGVYAYEYGCICLCICSQRSKEDIRYLHLVLLKQVLMEPEAKLLVNNCCLCPTPHPNRAGMFGHFLISHGSWDPKLGSYAYTTSSLAEFLIQS